MNRPLHAVLLAVTLAAASAAAALDKAQCPQPRFTGKAPAEYYERANPLPATADVDPVRRIYLGDSRRAACASCHGAKGDGRGELAELFEPPPRNFACAQTASGIPDGQLFWIIRFGSPGTSMPAHPNLSDDQVWRLVLYLRKLAR
jgi:mono/diheme cytochrome c family protein